MLSCSWTFSYEVDSRNDPKNLVVVRYVQTSIINRSDKEYRFVGEMVSWINEAEKILRGSSAHIILNQWAELKEQIKLFKLF